MVSMVSMVFTSDERVILKVNLDPDGTKLYRDIPAFNCIRYLVYLIYYIYVSIHAPIPSNLSPDGNAGLNELSSPRLHVSLWHVSILVDHPSPLLIVMLLTRHC